jgi:hypothetical protein
MKNIIVVFCLKKPLYIYVDVYPIGRDIFVAFHSMGRLSKELCHIRPNGQDGMGQIHLTRRPDINSCYIVSLIIQTDITYYIESTVQDI